jgi:hypothetical protein
MQSQECNRADWYRAAAPMKVPGPFHHPRVVRLGAPSSDLSFYADLALSEKGWATDTSREGLLLRDPLPTVQLQSRNKQRSRT